MSTDPVKIIRSPHTLMSCYKRVMTRRSLLLSVAALAGLGQVEVPAVAGEPVVALQPWLWCDRPVLGWRLECNAVSGAYMAFEGTDRAGLDRAFASMERLYPLSQGNIHREFLIFDEK